MPLCTAIRPPVVAEHLGIVQAHIGVPIDRRPYKFARNILQNMDAPEPLPHPKLVELWPLEEVERRLAQDYKMVHEGICIDSTAVRQETRRRTQLARGSISDARPGSLQEDKDEADLRKLFSLRLELTKDRIKIGPTPYHTSRFWAVLIGIDAYKSNPLRGCVSDALSMKKFLIEKLDVPEYRIQCLLGSNNPTSHNYMLPSRANIINILYNLIDKPEIQQVDNIIIYYAGHGSIYNCSDQCTATGSTCRTAGICPIEALCPIDRDTMDADGCWIPDISDRELNAIFRQISCVKGNKITFIADCCYAASMNRDPCHETEIRVMSPTCHSDVNDMLHAADTKLQHLPHYRSISSKDWRPEADSHIIVAATAGREYQFEKESRGRSKWDSEDFIRRLVEVLMPCQ